MLSYLNGTMDYEILLTKEESMECIVFEDSDSTSGYILGCLVGVPYHGKT